MTWAQTLNSSNVGNMLSNSMQNIKLDSTVSESEIKAKIALEQAKNSKDSNKTDNEKQNIAPSLNQEVQTPPQNQAATYPIQYPNVQYQPIQYNYQPVQYQSAQAANAYAASANASSAYQAQAASQNPNGQNLNVNTASVQQ